MKNKIYELASEFGFDHFGNMIINGFCADVFIFDDCIAHENFLHEIYSRHYEEISVNQYVWRENDTQAFYDEDDNIFVVINNDLDDTLFNFEPEFTFVNEDDID